MNGKAGILKICEMLLVLVVFGGLCTDTCSSQDANDHQDREFWLQRVRHSFLVIDLHNAMREKEFDDEWMLSSEQRRDLKDALDEYQQAMKEVSREGSRRSLELQKSGHSQEEIMQLSLERLREHRAQGVKNEQDIAAENLMKQVEEIFLPHQVVRLKQVLLQRELSAPYQGDRIAMILGLVSRLDLSEEDKLKLQEKVSEVRIEFQEKHQELQFEFVKRLFETLPKRTQEWLKEPDGRILNTKRISPKDKPAPPNGVSEGKVLENIEVKNGSKTEDQ
jgi:hypothetical protein